MALPAYQSRLHRFLHRAARLLVVGAGLKAALVPIGLKLRIQPGQLRRVHRLHLQQAESGGVQYLAAPRYLNQLGVPGGVLAPVDLLRQRPGGQLQPVQPVDQGGLAHPRLPSESVYRAPQGLPQGLYALPRGRRQHKGPRRAAPVLLGQGQRPLGVLLRLVHRHQGRYPRLAAQQQQPVGQQQVGLGEPRRQRNHQVVYVGHRRADQAVAPGQDGGKPTVFLSLPQGEAHVIPHQGGEALAAELGLGPKGIASPRLVHHRIKSAYAPQDLSFHAAPFTSFPVRACPLPLSVFRPASPQRRGWTGPFIRRPRIRYPFP